MCFFLKMPSAVSFERLFSKKYIEIAADVSMVTLADVKESIR